MRAIAISTSALSAVNERELRRRRGDLEALTDLAESLERSVDSSNIEGQKQAYLAAYQRFRSDGPAAAITVTYAGPPTASQAAPPRARRRSRSNPRASPGPAVRC